VGAFDLRTGEDAVKQQRRIPGTKPAPECSSAGKIAAFGAAIMAAICILVTQAVIKGGATSHSTAHAPRAANLSAGPFEEGGFGNPQRRHGAAIGVSQKTTSRSKEGEKEKAFNLASLERAKFPSL